MPDTVTTQLVRIPADSVLLECDLGVPPHARGLVLFAHGSGSSRHSPRNRAVAQVLQDAGMATLLADLLTVREDEIYERRFDIPLLASRLRAITQWAVAQPQLQDMHVGYFGASTGAGAAIEAAAAIGGGVVQAVVSRGGRPDLAGESLRELQAPVLLIVGAYDPVVIQLNREAYELVTAPKELRIVPRATHLFEEPGALEEVARLATEWFSRYLR